MARSRFALALGLAAFGLVSLAVAASGALVTNTRPNKRWYRSISKPRWTPPDRTFGVVWPILYGLIAWSGWRVWRSPAAPGERRAALAWWGAQMAFNAAWSPAFFGAHRPRLALGIVAGNELSLAAYTRAAARVDRVAAWAMAPYLAWVAFAGALNLEIVRRWKYDARAFK